MLKKDSIWLGLALGIILPALLYLLLFLMGTVFEAHHSLAYFARPFQGNKIFLLSLVANLVTLRIYFVNLKMDMTGRGILLATFVIGMGFFIVKSL